MTTLPQLIANAVETNPDGVALVLADGTGPLEQVGYADLDAWSSRLARALIARGIGPEDLVAVAVPRSLDAVLAVWAVAKTGAGFVPIDPAYPPAWVAHLLVDTGAVYGLAVSWVRNELPEEIEWLQVDTVDTARSLEQFSADAVTYADRVRPLRAEHPAYVTYVTDGETLPDGVVVTQAGLSGLCSEQQGRYRVEPDDRTLNFAPLPSDSSVLELLLALGGAATMVVVSPLVTQAEDLTALLQRTGVTHAYLPADALELVDPAGLDELGVVIAGRRPCPPESVQRWAVPVAGGSTRALYQGYGPAEATVMAGISSPLIPGGPPTLGAPIRGVTVRVLDGQLNEVSDGAVGELYLGGLPLARGYHRRPGRTAQLLVADPFAEDGSRLYRTGDLVRRDPGGVMEYMGRGELPALDGPAAAMVRAGEKPAAPAAGDAGPPPTDTAVPGPRPDEASPDYEQSLPIRDPASPDRVRDTDRSGVGPSGTGSEADASAPSAAGSGPSGPPAPVSGEYGAGADSDRPSPGSLPENGSRPASEQRDMELRGRGYLEMPDRQQPLPERGAYFDSPADVVPDPVSYETSGTAVPGTAVRTDHLESADSGPAAPELGATPDQYGNSADDWLHSGRQLPGPPGDLEDPGDRFAGTADPWPGAALPGPADQLPGASRSPDTAAALPVRGAATPIPSDATAFYENPPSAEQEPDRRAVSRPTRPPAGRPDWAAPPAWSAESELPGGSGGGPADPADSAAVADEIRPAGPPKMVERPATIPLSPGQLQLWERNQNSPGIAVETITAAMRLTGSLDATAMQAAVADVVDRHETLRTVYPAAGGEPHQVVLPREQAVPEVVAEPVPAANLTDWLHSLAQTDFDAADAEQVPVRFALAELGPQEHVVAIVVHRILADDVSAGLLLRDLLRAFLGRRNRSRPLWQPLTIQYLDYFLGRRAELGDIGDPESLAVRRLAYWREYLADLPPRLELPAGPAADATGEGVHAFDIGTRTHRRIAEIAQRAGTSEFIVLRTAFTVLLARSAAVADIVLGSSVRGSDERELDDAIGPYANTVVLRTHIDPAESFLDLVQRVVESDRRAFAHADLPFELITAELGIDGPLYDVAIALRHNDIPRLEMPNLATEPVEVPGAPVGAALRLVIDPHRAPDGAPDGIAAAFHFTAQRIGHTTVTEVARRFQRLLTVAGADPEGPVGDIDLLSRADLDRLLVVWNDTRYPVAPELLLDGYRRTVGIRPDTVAVADSETELSYQEFDGRVNRLARRLIEAGVGAETVVGIATRSTPDLVVAIYAVLTAGGAYLPLDPRDPANWTAQVLDTATPALLLADRASESRAAQALRASRQAAPVLLVDSGELGQYSAEPVRPAELIRPARPGNTACVMCVSAAADGPELAVLSHTALNNQITLMLAQTPLGFTDVYLQRNAATAATSLWGFFLPLRAGAELVLTGPANTRAIADAVAAHGVTVTDFGPAELAEFAEHLDPERGGSLREIFVTGEPLAPETVTALRARCGAQVHNLYGTCETAVSVTSWPAAGSAETSVPIGLPQWNTRVYVLDSRLRPVPPGVPGELYLAGDQLARGYANRAALTADRFVANPFGYGQRMYRTGDLVLWRDATHATPQRLDLLGRTDHQVRFRGHRIRPHIIAAALRTLPGIADAAVLMRTVAAGSDPTAPGSRLAVYVVPEPGAAPHLDQIRAGLAGLLPATLLPVAFRTVEQIPVTAAGEPDSARLPDPDEVPVLTGAFEPTPVDTVAQPGSHEEPAVATTSPASTADIDAAGEISTALADPADPAGTRAQAADVDSGAGIAEMAGGAGAADTGPAAPDMGAQVADSDRGAGAPGGNGDVVSAASSAAEVGVRVADADGVGGVGRRSSAADPAGDAGVLGGDAGVAGASAPHPVGDAAAAVADSDRGAGAPGMEGDVAPAASSAGARGADTYAVGGVGERPSAVDPAGGSADLVAGADAGAGEAWAGGRPDHGTAGVDRATAIGAGFRPVDRAADSDIAETAGTGNNTVESAQFGQGEAPGIDAGTFSNAPDAVRAAISEPQRESAVEGEIFGELPVTPTVIRLLDNPLPGVEVRSIVLELPAGRPLGHTEAVVRALVLRHPMLSARLDTGDRSPALWIPPREQRGDRQYWWLDPESGENAVATDDVVQAAADALDPAAGRNIHFVVTGAESARRLVVVANGLVVDDRSWRVIIDELIAGDTGPGGSESRLPQLVQALEQRAGSIDLLDEAGWWRRNLAGARAGAPLGGADLRGRRRVSLAITAEGTAAVTSAADAYQATVPEVLLTAVAIALRTGAQGAVVQALGSLVRCDADARPMVGRSDDLIGGFTTEFPLSVQMADIDTADALVGGPAAGVALTQIRDLVRSIPGGGAGYALLRYLSTETSAEFAAADSGRFTLRYRDLRPARVHTDGPADGVPLVLTVDVTDDGLLCRFDYATEVFVGEDVKTFAEHWVRALGGLAEHGLRPTSPVPAPRTPSGPDAYGPAAAESQASSGPDAYGPAPTDPRVSSETDSYVSAADRPQALSELDSYTPPGAGPRPAGPDVDGPAEYETGAAPGGPGAPRNRQPPVPDAEVTSLLRPITEPPHPPVPGTGLPPRRRRSPDTSLPSDSSAGPGLPQRGRRAQDESFSPDPSGPDGPQRGSRPGERVTGTDDRRPAESASGLSASAVPGAGPEGSASRHRDVAALGSNGLPQRRPHLGERVSDDRRPESSAPSPSAEAGAEQQDAADRRAEAAGPASGALAQRRPQTGGRDTEAAGRGPETSMPGLADSSRAGAESRGSAAPSGEDPAEPSPSGLPQRRPRTGEQVAGAEHPRPEVSMSGADVQPPAGAESAGFPEERGEAAGLGPNGLPQRHPRSAAAAVQGPETSLSGGADPSRADADSAAFAGEHAEAAGVGPSGLPQRFRTGEQLAGAGDRPDESLSRPGAGAVPGVDADQSGEASSIGPGGLPQRRPRNAETSARGPETSWSGLADPSRAGAESGASAGERAEAGGLGPSGLPQRGPRPQEASIPSESSAGPGLPQPRSRMEVGAGDRPDESLSRPGAGAESGVVADQSGEALGGLPQRRSGIGQQVAGTEHLRPEGAVSGPDALRRAGTGPAGSPEERGEAAGLGPSGLPQRRPGIGEQAGETADRQPDALESGPAAASGGGVDSSGRPAQSGLPQRQPRSQGGPLSAESSAELPVASGLPQRRPQAREQLPESRGGPEAPLAGLVELPQSNEEPAPASLPQRRPASAEPSAPLPRRRPDLAAAADGPAGANRESPALTTEPESTADPEPTTFLRPVTDVETTAYMSPVRDLGAYDDKNTLLSLFDEQASRTPADPAVRQGARLLSYAELDRKSRALAVELIRFGVGGQTPVAVAMRPGIDLVVAVCAVLRAGGAYVPVDPGGSAEGFDRVLAAAEPICVLSISDDGVTTATGIPVVAIDLLYLDMPTDPAADPPVAADDIADIRYGPDTAAGVAGTHRQMVERLRRAQRSHPYDSADLVLHAAPRVGDITLWELFRPLHSGAQILMPDHPGRAADLSRSIAAHRVTIVHVVPALLDRFLDSVTDGGGRAAHPSLRRLVVDGAALPPGGVERFMNLLPGAELVIWYGHDETGVITVGSVGARPVTNDRVYLLDEQLRPVPPGTAGEMYIGGPQLARGFYDAAGETAVRFVAAAGGRRLYRTGDIVRRRDGVLEYLGRAQRPGGSLPVASRRGGHD